MNFFGVGPAELIVILVVALVFVGPERLPKLAADLARTIREIRKYTGSLAAEFNEVIQDFERETEGERSSWKEIGEGLSGATQSVTDVLRAARTDAESGGAPAPADGATQADSSESQPGAATGGNGAVHEATWREIPDAATPPPSDTAIPTANGTPGTADAPAEEPR
ncbi:MAG: twin-arginine translocase TatA/TatE family subunit [Chloroflexota bacterium]|nr:twin-arginine translocase TatA/TatE family subunit [Chloroflexota bacterium]